MTPLADHIAETRDVIEVRCEAPNFNGGTFTHGRTYRAIHCINALYAVTDDKGHVRYIIPDEPCPHLPPRWREFGREGLGRFVTADC